MLAAHLNRPAPDSRSPETGNPSPSPQAPGGGPANAGGTPAPAVRADAAARARLIGRPRARGGAVRFTVRCVRRHVPDRHDRRGGPPHGRPLVRAHAAGRSATHGDRPADERGPAAARPRAAALRVTARITLAGTARPLASLSLPSLPSQNSRGPRPLSPHPPAPVASACSCVPLPYRPRAGVAAPAHAASARDCGLTAADRRRPLPGQRGARRGAVQDGQARRQRLPARRHGRVTLDLLPRARQRAVGGLLRPRQEGPRAGLRARPRGGRPGS